MSAAWVPRAGLALALVLCAHPSPAQSPQPPAGQHEGHAGHPASPAPGEADQRDHPRPAEPLPPGIPPLTDADRAAAFPDVHGHTVHDGAVHYLVRVDRLEGRTGAGPGGLAWDSHGWIGRDRDRLWFRSEGAGRTGSVAGEAHLLYGRAISRWWDLVAGMRQDAGGGPGRTWAAVGIQGLAPYWLEVEVTGYVGPSGRTQVRLETEYDLLVTNRLVLQPRIEANVFGRSDAARGIGAGLSSIESGLRLRYELRRELAPYVGVVWNRRFFGTRELAEADGRRAGQTRLAGGVRIWF